MSTSQVGAITANALLLFLSRQFKAGILPGSKCPKALEKKAEPRKLWNGKKTSSKKSAESKRSA